RSSTVLRQAGWRPMELWMREAVRNNIAAWAASWKFGRTEVLRAAVEVGLRWLRPSDVDHLIRQWPLPRGRSGALRALAHARAEHAHLAATRRAALGLVRLGSYLRNRCECGGLKYYKSKRCGGCYHPNKGRVTNAVKRGQSYYNRCGCGAWKRTVSGACARCAQRRRYAA